MFASPHALQESLQVRLEAISMRLDAATDNLLQTRDLLIRHLEQQMLQLQEVRGALHETATETERWKAEASPVPASPPAPPVKPMGELTLESLFAPLNAAPRPPVAPLPSVIDVEEASATEETAEAIFESEPAAAWEPPQTQKESSRPAAASAGSAAVLDLKPQTIAANGDIDPELEKATLDELNEALTRAFAQIASRNTAT